MAAQRTMTGSALHAASLLATILAIITGILGMHVMTGTHSTAHSNTTVTGGTPDTSGPVPSTPSREASGHAGHLAASPQPAALQELSTSSGAAVQAQCSCSGNCSNQHSMSAPCIPTVAAGGLAAPVPDDSVSITGQSEASTITAHVRWSYRPGSPSPGELSISRT